VGSGEILSDSDFDWLPELYELMQVHVGLVGYSVDGVITTAEVGAVITHDTTLCSNKNFFWLSSR
jgi:hypothetical protein